MPEIACGSTLGQDSTELADSVSGCEARNSTLSYRLEWIRSERSYLQEGFEIVTLKYEVAMPGLLENRKKHKSWSLFSKHR